MARLGELLVAAGLLTTEQVGQALRAQVMWGGRLGTNLIELGFVDLDTLSTTLGRQQRMPAALARHFDKSNPALQRLLSPDVAERYLCVPLRKLGPDQRIVLASVAPLDKRGLAIVADEMAIEPAQLLPAIAAELRIRYHLERVYQIPRTSRFLRSRGKTIPPFPQFEVIPVPPESEPDLVLPIDTSELPVVSRPTTGPLAEPPDPALAAPDALAAADEICDTAHDLAMFVATLEDEDLAAATALPGEPDTGRERRHYVRTIADEPATDSERALGRIAIRKVAAQSPGTGATLGETTRAIRRGTDRDGIAALVIDAVFRFAPSCESAVVLVIRGDVAISWKGFCRSGAPPPEIAVPVDQPGLIPRAVQHCSTQRAPSVELGPIDQLLLVSLGHQVGDLVAIPVSIAGQVMCVLAMVVERNSEIAGAEAVALAAGAAFARLMRDSAR